MVTGRKTEPFETARPDKPAVWAQTVEPGGTVYIPRDWSHLVKQMDEPAIHLAITFKNPNGRELASHAFGRLQNTESMRTYCPRFADARVQSSYLMGLQRALIEGVTAPGLFLGFLNDIQLLVEPRVCLGLPWSAMDVLPEHEENYVIVSLIRFPSAAVIKHVENEDAIEVCHDRKLIRFHAATEGIIQSVMYDSPMTVKEFFTRWTAEFERQQLNILLRDLVKQGVVVLRNGVLRNKPI